MNKFIALGFVVTLSLLSGMVFAGPPGLVQDLTDAEQGLQTTVFKAHLDEQTAQFKYDTDARVATATGQALPTYDTSTITALAAQVNSAQKEAETKGRDAYKRWIVGKKAEQVDSAKKLFSTWLTKLDVEADFAKDPNTIGDSDAGLAYRQAVNDFRVDNE